MVAISLSYKDYSLLTGNFKIYKLIKLEATTH